MAAITAAVHGDIVSSLVSKIVRIRGRLRGDQHDHGDHQNQARQPAKNESQAFPGAAFGGQDHDERRQAERLQGDSQAEEGQISDHISPPRRGALAQLPGEDPRPEADGVPPERVIGTDV
jgi:hypothetical protein